MKAPLVEVEQDHGQYLPRISRRDARRIVSRRRSAWRETIRLAEESGGNSFSEVVRGRSWWEGGVRGGLGRGQRDRDKK